MAIFSASISILGTSNSTTQVEQKTQTTAIETEIFLFSFLSMRFFLVGSKFMRDI